MWYSSYRILLIWRFLNKKKHFFLIKFSGELKAKNWPNSGLTTTTKCVNSTDCLPTMENARPTCAKFKLRTTHWSTQTLYSNCRAMRTRFYVQQMDERDYKNRGKSMIKYKNLKCVSESLYLIDQPRRQLIL